MNLSPLGVPKLSSFDNIGFLGRRKPSEFDLTIGQEGVLVNQEFINKARNYANGVQDPSYPSPSTPTKETKTKKQEDDDNELDSDEEAELRRMLLERRKKKKRAQKLRSNVLATNSNQEETTLFVKVAQSWSDLFSENPTTTRDERILYISYSITLFLLFSYLFKLFRK